MIDIVKEYCLDKMESINRLLDPLCEQLAKENRQRLVKQEKTGKVQQLIMITPTIANLEGQYRAFREVLEFCENY